MPMRSSPTCGRSLVAQCVPNGHSAGGARALAGGSTQVTYTADASNVDHILEQAKAAAGDDPIRLRIQPQVWLPKREYVAWRKVSWPVRCDTVAEAVSLRLALEAFFHAVALRGPSQVAQELYALAEPPLEAPVWSAP